MGTKARPGKFDCYEKAEADEPLFVLLARDPDAPALIRQWVCYKQLRGDTSDEKLLEALNCADEMDRWHKNGQRDGT